MRIFSTIQLFLLLTLISLLIFTIDYFKILNYPKKFLFFLTNPISFSLYSGKQTLVKQFLFITNARFAAQENKALQETVGKLLSENADLKKTLAETSAQLSQEQHLDPKTYKTTPARPIGLERFLKIDRGSTEGIKVGQPVVLNDNLIGQVVLTSENGSSIRQLTDPDSKVAAFSFGKSGKAKGILVGQFGTGMTLDKVLHEEQIEVGDLIYSEGTEGFWPRGLILGKVSEIIEKQNELFKSAKIVPVFDIRDADLVFVIQE